MKKIILLTVAFVLVSCANYEPVPEGYTGPTATIADTAYRKTLRTAEVFAVVAIDGHGIQNSIYATREASSYGLGIKTQYVERKVPIQPLTLKLVATHVGDLPITELVGAISGNYLSVEGIVTFTPELGGSYYVRGGLLPEEISVWIANAKTGERVTEKIIEK